MKCSRCDGRGALRTVYGGREQPAPDIAPKVPGAALHICPDCNGTGVVGDTGGGGHAHRDVEAERLLMADSPSSSSHWERVRRWWVMRFRTSVRPGTYNRHAGRILTVEEWESGGGWADALRPGWTVERPDWWDWGSTSAVTAETVEEARARLDEWQDEMAARP